MNSISKLAFLLVVCVLNVLFEDEEKSYLYSMDFATNKLTELLFYFKLVLVAVGFEPGPLL